MKARIFSPSFARLRRRLELAALLMLTGVAVWLWTAPLRAERAWRRASLQELVQAARRDPNNPRVFYYQGLRLRQLGYDGPALAAFARAATLDGDDESAWLAWAATAGAFHDDNEALGILNTYLQKHPSSAPAHYARALLYQQKLLHASALREAQEAVRLDPQNADAWRVVGVEATAAQDAGTAEKAMRRAVELRPNDWRNHLGLGNALQQKQANAEAVQEFTAAARLAPKEALPALALGDALLGLAHSPAEIEAARAHIVQAVNLAPNLPAAYFVLGQSYAAQERWKEAALAWQKAEPLDPTNTDLHFQLSKAYRHLGHVAAAQREAALHDELRRYEVDKLNAGSLAHAANDSASRLRLARLFAEHGDFAQAADTYRSALSHDANLEDARRELADLEAAHPDAVTRRAALPMPGGSAAPTVATADLLRDAALLLERKAYPEAEQAYRTLVARDLDSAPANQGLGLALDAQQKSDEAFRYLNHALQRDPKLADAQFALARLYYQAGFADEAAKRLGLLVKQVPGNAEYWYRLGMINSSMVLRYAEAEQACAQAVKLAPNNAAYQIALATMQEKLHKISQAETTFRHALALAPDDLQAQFMLGKFLANHPGSPAQQQEAETLLNKALARAPNYPEGLYALGRLELAKGDTPQAIAHLQKSIDGAPQVAATYYELAQAYARAGDTRRAEAMRTAFRNLSSFYTDLNNTQEQARLHLKDAGLRLKLARLYAKGGENAKAINQYEYCLRLAPTNASVRAERDAFLARLKVEGRLPSMTAFNGMITASILGH